MSLGCQRVELNCSSVTPESGSPQRDTWERQALRGLGVPDRSFYPDNPSVFHQAPGVGDDTQGKVSNQMSIEKRG